MLPDMDVSGMTEFILSYNCKLGLMSITGIAKILSGYTLHPYSRNGIPGCEM